MKRLLAASVVTLGILGLALGGSPAQVDSTQYKGEFPSKEKCIIVASWYLQHGAKWFSCNANGPNPRSWSLYVTYR